MNSASAREYSLRLRGFGNFITMGYKMTLDDLIKKINQGTLDPYDVLTNYVAHLKASYNVSTLTLKQRVTTGGYHQYTKCMF